MKKWIPKTSVKTLLIELGANEEELTEEVIDEIMTASNLGDVDRIEFREFLIASAVGLFLKNTGENQSARFQEIREGFLVVRHAFEQIDEDKSEAIDFEELKSAFLSMREDDLIIERLRELDFHGSKAITFPEFVYGMCAWVGMSDDDTDDFDGPESLSPQVNNKSFDLNDELEHANLVLVA